jgi:hypothetical protein
LPVFPKADIALQSASITPYARWLIGETKALDPGNRRKEEGAAILSLLETVEQGESQSESWAALDAQARSCWQT